MSQLRPLILALLVIVTSSAWAATDKEPVDLKVGDTAPHFVGRDDKNEKWDSKKHAGKHIYVVYFYPADMTGGCTTQACSYRDAHDDLEELDVEVIGISGDTVENHQHFKRAHDLNFTLLADPKGKIAEAFGVKFGEGGSIERLIDGEEITLTRGITTGRWTFVIDEDWHIAHKDEKANAQEDMEKVKKVVAGLKSQG